MEIPLSLDRVLANEEIDGAFCLGIIEKGETDHGLVMGQGVLKTILVRSVIALPECWTSNWSCMQSMHYARSSTNDCFRFL